MAAFDRSAYPRFPPKISGREIVARYTPSSEEIEWSHSVAHAIRLQHASLVLLKCFQQLHYFPEPADIPAEIRSHIVGAIGIENEDAFSLSAATRYRQQTAIRRYLGISPFYGNEGRRLAIRAASQAVLVVNHRVDLVNGKRFRPYAEITKYSIKYSTYAAVQNAPSPLGISSASRRFMENPSCAYSAM